MIVVIRSWHVHNFHNEIAVKLEFEISTCFSIVNIFQVILYCDADVITFLCFLGVNNQVGITICQSKKVQMRSCHWLHVERRRKMMQPFWKTWGITLMNSSMLLWKNTKIAFRRRLRRYKLLYFTPCFVLDIMAIKILASFS